MEDNHMESEETNYLMQKRDRNFEKVLQAVNYRPVKISYCKHRCANPGNMKKKYKVDAPNVSGSSSNSVVKAPSFSLTMCMTDGYKDTFNLNDLSEELKRQNKLEMRCQSLLRLAFFCSGELSETELGSVLDVLDLLSDSHESDALAVCHTLLLFALTQKPLTLDQIINVEESILKVANSVIPTRNAFGSNTNVPRIDFLKGEQYLAAYKLCQKLFSDEGPDIDNVDMLTICCSSLRSLSKNQMAMEYKYSNSTLKFVVGMTGKATQEIMSENPVHTEDCIRVSPPSHVVNQCLQVLEHVLSVDPDLPCRILDHEDFSLLHCLTRLLGWCISFPFKGEQSENHLVNNSYSSFHLSTLVSILKILSILSFNPDQYDSFTNIKGLMEKVMICILKAYFQSKENRFDVLVLALELMINFYIKNKKTFVLLCLKKFRISNCEEILSIEALLKILANSLEKINEIKAKALAKSEEENAQNNETKSEEENSQNSDIKSEEESTQNGTKSEENLHNNNTKNSEDEDMKMVLEAADEDMELSTIVSFVSILLVFFMDTKKSFLEFIRAKLSLEASTEAISVSKKVLQFASLTGGMPITGILLLRHAIKKLSRLYESA